MTITQLLREKMTFKHSRFDEADSSSAPEGDIDEPEPTSHEGDSSVLTSTTVESSSAESSC